MNAETSLRPAQSGCRPPLETKPPTFSVIIPCSRPEPLARCLESLARAEGLPPDELLLVVTRNAPACEEVIARFSERLPGLRILDGRSLSPGAARNLAIASSRGDWLCFLDDDVTVPRAYFRVLEGTLRRHPRASAIGGPNLTPPDSPLFERCVGHVLGSRSVAGPLARRCSGLPMDSWCDDRALILCNLCVRREALAREGLRFEEGLLRNEENLLLERLLRRGHRALHCPALFVHHERRRDLASFARQCFLSGRGRAQMTLKLPSSFRAVYLAPPTLLCALLGAAIFPRALGPAAGLYAVGTLANAVRLAARRGEPAAAIAWLWLLQWAAQLGYAAGLVAGVAGTRCASR